MKTATVERFRFLFLLLLIWPAGMGLLGLILGLFLSPIVPAPPEITIGLSLFNTLFISAFPVGTSIFLIIKSYEKRSFRYFIFYTVAALVAVILGEQLNRVALQFFFPLETLEPGKAICEIQWFPSILLTLLISGTFYFVRIPLILPPGNAAMESIPETEQLMQSETPGPGEQRETLRVFIRRQETDIPFAKIIYLTAVNKRTVIHTTGRDLEVAETLKSIQARLPHHQFLRIHKSYAANRSFIVDLQREEDGTYFLTLRDEDETRLPAGRAHLPHIRKVIVPDL